MTSRLTTAHARCATSLLLLFVLLSGCGRIFEDKGTHLAYAMEKGAAKLRASGGPEIAVHYTSLYGANELYYVEITPTVSEGQKTAVARSYLVVSGKTPDGTSYHNRFVVVPQRLYVKKDQGALPILSFKRTATKWLSLKCAE